MSVTFLHPDRDFGRYQYLFPVAQKLRLTA